MAANLIDGALKSMDIKTILLFFFCSIWITNSQASLDSRDRLSPYSQGLADRFGEGSNHGAITLEKELRAVYDPNNEAAAVRGDRLGRFSLIKEPNLHSLRSSLNFSNSIQDLRGKDFLVGFDGRSQRRVILTGNLIIKYTPNLNLDSIQSNYPIQLVKDFPKIKTAFFKVLDSESLPEIERSVGQEPHVLNVRMEQLQFGKRAR